MDALAKTSLSRVCFRMGRGNSWSFPVSGFVSGFGSGFGSGSGSGSGFVSGSDLVSGDWGIDH